MNYQLEKLYSIQPDSENCTQDSYNTNQNQFEIYNISDVEQLLHYRCQKLQKHIGDDIMQCDDLIYYIWNYLAQSFSLQLKIYMKQQEQTFLSKIVSQEQSYINFFIIIRNINKKIHKQFNVLAEFTEQLFMDAINKFLLEGDQFIDEWLEQKMFIFQQQRPDLVIEMN